MKSCLSIWIVIVASLIGCDKKVYENDRNHIVLIGIAENMKGGIGVTSDENLYQFDLNVYSWNNNFGKRIRVEGELFVEILPPVPPRDTTMVPPPPPPQRAPYDFLLFIKNPKWDFETIKEDRNHFTLVGTAINSESGACVISDSVVYHINGVKTWDEKNVNKKIQVEGEFFVDYLPPKDSTQLPPYDYLLIVKNPKW